MAFGDYVYNALTGRLSADQVAQIQAQTAADIKRAGGSDADAAAAAAEVGNYNQQYSGGTAESYAASTLIPGLATGTVLAVALIALGIVFARREGIL